MFKAVLGRHEEGRLWYDGDQMELIVWKDPQGELRGFQLCYDQDQDEHALTWKKESGLSHSRVDSGNEDPNANRSPILLSDGAIPVSRILSLFDVNATSIDAALAKSIRERLLELCPTK